MGEIPLVGVTAGRGGADVIAGDHQPAGVRAGLQLDGSAGSSGVPAPGKCKQPITIVP